MGRCFPGECEALIKADALDELLQDLDRAINQSGIIPRAGQNEPLMRHWFEHNGE
ncbi:hypothetical protein M2324_001826 [Rhodovulum sulfidophilum]|nr:hypothetical protein [Rhodovulum sulfidophilum]